MSEYNFKRGSSACNRLLTAVLVIASGFGGLSAIASADADDPLTALADADGLRRDAPLSPDELRLIAIGITTLDADDQDDLLEHMERRLGLDVNPAGYMLTFDRVRLSRGEAEHFGSIPNIVDRKVVPPLNAAAFTPRRLNVGGEAIETFYAEVDRRLSSGIAPADSYAADLQLSPRRVPENPTLRFALLEWADKDQAARNDGDMDAISRVEAAATPWLKRIIRESGFPSCAEVGLAGVTAAWLLTQHADSDIDFMELTLSLVEKQWRDGAFSPVHYALLADRVRVLRYRPQIYGTQMGADSAGAFFYAVEALPDINTRRASVGLPPLSPERLASIRWVLPVPPKESAEVSSGRDS
jgi:hypothetical protein